MKKFSLAILVVLLLVVTTGFAPAPTREAKLFFSHLTGAQEVPPRVTPARGNAAFLANKDDTELKFILTVSRINNVFAAHIHCGAPGVNGPIGITLFMGTPGSGPAPFVLAHGTITAPDPGNACGWVTLADALAAMRSGNTYTNVHTNDGIDPPNTGPGDFPGGEIRGQIF